MLAAPDNKVPNDKRTNKRPLFAAKDIKDFYLQNSPKIFPQNCNMVTRIKSLFGPLYDGKYLHESIQNNLKNIKLGDTLTNIVIPTFDIKQLQPVIFSSYEMKERPYLNAPLSDICIATSAAPTYLPPHQFITSHNNIKHEFNLVDGGMAANNPTLIAMGEIAKQLIRGDSDFPLQPQFLEYHRYLVISLGTGQFTTEGKYNATKASKWGLFGWGLNPNGSPLLDIFTQASTDMVDIHLSVVFEALKVKTNYLRIQADGLESTLSSFDKATPENLRHLVKKGEELLKKNVSTVNLENGKFEPYMDKTNAQALTEFAKKLSDEKNLRESKASCPIS